MKLHFDYLNGILTRSIPGASVVCTADEQNPSSTPGSLEQMNPSQQSE